MKKSNQDQTKRPVRRVSVHDIVPGHVISFAFENAAAAARFDDDLVQVTSVTHSDGYYRLVARGRGFTIEWKLVPSSELEIVVSN